MAFLGRVWRGYVALLQRRPYATNIATAGVIGGAGDILAQRIEWWRAKAVAREEIEGRVASSLAAHGDSARADAERDGLLRRVEQRERQLAEAAGAWPHWLNAQRVGVVSLWGFTFGGAPMVAWYRALDRMVPVHPPTLRSVLTKVVVNQTTASPVMNSLFFGFVIFWGRVVGLDTGLARKKGAGAEEEQQLLSVSEALLQWKEKLRQELWPTTVRAGMAWGPAHVVNFFFVPGQFRVLFLSCGLVFWTAYLSIVGHKTDDDEHTALVEER